VELDEEISKAKRDIQKQYEIGLEFKAQRDALNRAVKSYLDSPCENTRNVMLIAHFACEREKSTSYALGRIEQFYEN